MNNLSKILKERNISVAKLATSGEIIITESVINQYISGAKLPSVASLINISNYLDCSIDYLLDRDDNPMRVSKMNTLINDQQMMTLISTVSSLDDEKKKLVDAYVKGLIANNQ